jgi:hypothetical protein
MGELSVRQRGAAGRVVAVRRPDHAPPVAWAKLAAGLLPLMKGGPIEEEELVHQVDAQRNEDDQTGRDDCGYEKELRGIVMRSMSSSRGPIASATPVHIVYQSPVAACGPRQGRKRDQADRSFPSH